MLRMLRVRRVLRVLRVLRNQIEARIQHGFYRSPAAVR
jgi:hypothetical protein